MSMPLQRTDKLDWRDYLLATSVAILFSETFYILMSSGWKKADYDHGFFILPIVAWLIFRQRQWLRRSSRWSVAGLGLFLAGLLTAVFSIVSDFLFLQALAFVIVVAGIFASRLAGDSLRRIGFPLAYLFFMIPPPVLVIDSITFPLKEVATWGSYGLLKFAQLPVSVEGAVLRVGAYDFFVSDACSGWRSLVTLLALGSLYAHLQKTTLARKWVIFLSVVPIGIAANVLRIFATGLIAHWIGIRYAEGFFHEVSGFVVYFIAILGLIAVTAIVVRRVRA